MTTIFIIGLVFFPVVLITIAAIVIYQDRNNQRFEKYLREIEKTTMDMMRSID